MKQQQVIMGSITATVSAIAVGYLGVQYLNQTAMYTVAGAMLGLGATTQVTQQLKSKSHVRRSQLLLPPSLPVITVSEEPPQPMQPIYQSSEPYIDTKLQSQSKVAPVIALAERLPAGYETKWSEAISPDEKLLQQNATWYYQPSEPHIEDYVEVIESDFSKELRAEIDPIIERFLKLGLEEF